MHFTKFVFTNREKLTNDLIQGRLVEKVTFQELLRFWEPYDLTQ